MAGFNAAKLCKYPCFVHDINSSELCGYWYGLEKKNVSH